MSRKLSPSRSQEYDDEYVYEGHIYEIYKLRYIDGGDVVAFCLDKGTPLNQTPPAEGDDVTGWRGA